MRTIVIISNESFWTESQKTGEYIQSTIGSTLDDVGFIHCTSPEQTIMIANRHFAQYENLILLMIDSGKVKPEVKFEASLSGRGGIYPHIYGPLNVDAVYNVVALSKNENGGFTTPPELLSQTAQPSN
jgi:uncharacterized protein (DUF952 family)